MDLSAIPGLVADTLVAGLPPLAVQFGLTGILLVVGAWLYKRVSPIDEDAMVAAGNAAGGIVLAASWTALALPLAATLASHRSAIDVLVWGLVALAIQLLVFRLLLRRDPLAAIRQGNAAAAIALAAKMLAFSLINAGAMLG